MNGVVGVARGRRATVVVGLLIVAVVAATLSAVALAVDPPKASAAVASSFEPGYIISDANFTASNSLTESQIQAFLVAQEPTCRATTGPACLRSYAVSTTSRVDAAHNCATYAGGSNQTAATIVKNVATACGLSPKVLLVLLQKEQGLVTSTAPTATMYRSATGYGCPDTAACDSTYYGFFNQVYMAALQFKRYAASPTYWAYQAGRTTNILYSPNAKCGTKSVAIRNQATASLYNYTPYTPNAAALANLYGTGDACSSYGNRNFWRLYTDWFGSTTGGVSPVGAVDAVTAGNRRIVVTGWTMDLDTTAAIRAHVYVDGKAAKSVAADVDRPDLVSALGAGNTVHGFAAEVDGLSPGNHTVCVYGINVGPGGNTQIGCKTVGIRSGAPFGVMDAASAVTGSVSVRGWAIDPDSAGPISVKVLVDGTSRTTAAASGAKAGLDAVYPGFGDAHAYSATIGGVAVGTHSVCAVGVNVGTGANSQIACRSVVVRSGNPQLELTSAVSPLPGTISLAGTALDYDTTSALRVHVYVDGRAVQSLAASASSSSIGSANPGYGPNHAFSASLTGLGAGTHDVCVYAINVGAGANTVICRAVAGPTGAPKLSVVPPSSSSLSAITVTGWAVDPDTTPPVQVRVYVDGRGVKSVLADLVSASASAAMPGYGTGHGFSIGLAGFGPGAHTVCVYAINVGGGSNSVNCETVRMTTGTPTLHLDELSSPSAGQVTVRGWVIDPDTIAPIQVRVYVDGIGKASITADIEKSSLATVYGAYGPRHQFTVALAGLAPGPHQVCTFAINVSVGGNASTCSTLVVR